MVIDQPIPIAQHRGERPGPYPEPEIFLQRFARALLPLRHGNQIFGAGARAVGLRHSHMLRVAEIALEGERILGAAYRDRQIVAAALYADAVQGKAALQLDSACLAKALDDRVVRGEDSELVAIIPRP